MELITLILLSIGLSVDSFAVSVSSGVIISGITFRKATRIAFFLAIFQAVMPLIGWFIGKRIESLVESFDHWLAFGLLAIIGGKMILESLKPHKDAARKSNPMELKVLLGMSLATSIDALVVGISFGFIQVDLWFASVIIGFTTFVFSMLGILFGKKIGGRFGEKMEIIGGIVLILIGLKILFQHLMA
jgi:manganese efflux pump family protein